MTGVLTRRGRFEDKRHREEDHVVAETEIGEMQLQVKELEGLPATTRR